MERDRILEMCRPFYDCWTSAFETAWSDMIENRLGRRFIANCHKSERAGMVHAFAREALRIGCDELEPFVSLVQEPDGRQLDYMLVRVGNDTLAVRWGRYDPVRGCIKRNDTLRQMDMRGQGYFDAFGSMDELAANFPVVTLGYELADDEVMGGLSRAWIRRVLLIRERLVASEIIDVISSRERARVVQTEEKPVIVTISDDMAEALRRQARGLRRKLA